MSKRVKIILYSITGFIDYFSSKTNISNENVNLVLDDFDIRYKYYQIGFICVAKDSSKAFRSNDININNTYFNLSIAESNEYSINDLILDNYNYYNVKNIINYQNRLYISNFKQSSNPIISESELSKIKIKYKQEEINIDDFAYQNIYVETREGSELANVISSEKSNIDGNTDYDIIESNPYYIGAQLGSVIIGDDIVLHNQVLNNETGYIVTKSGNNVTANLVVTRGSQGTINVIEINAIINGKEYKAIYKMSVFSIYINICISIKHTIINA